MIKRILILLFVFLVGFNLPSGASIANESASPNYIVILIHGVISNKEAFDGDNGLKHYLENDHEG
jgi:hypothetical protein